MFLRCHSRKKNGKLHRYYPGHYSFNVNYSSRRGIANVPLMEEPPHDLRLLLPAAQVAADVVDHFALVARPGLSHRLFGVLVEAFIRIQLRVERGAQNACTGVG